LGDVADDLHAQVPGRLEAEGWGGAGQGQIVVDGLGDVSNPDGAAGLLIELAAREGRVVAADGHECIQSQLAEGLQNAGHVLGVLGRVSAGRAKDGSSADVDDLDLIDGQFANVFRAPLDQPLEAVPETEDLGALFNGLDGGGTDDAVDARSGTATNNKTQTT